MMSMAPENAVVPEESLPPAAQRPANQSLSSDGSACILMNPNPNSNANADTWAEVKSVPSSNATSPAQPVAIQRSPTKSPSGLQIAMRRLTTLFSPSENPHEMERRKSKSHYRRGSILIKHLEDKKATGKATEKDMKFFEMVKSQFDNNIMESRTIISLSVFQTGTNPLDDPFAVIHMPLEIQQGFRRKLFAIFAVQLFAVVGLVCFFSYVPFVVTLFEPAFATWPALFAAFVAMVLALLWLYAVKYRFPLNFAVLSIYTVTQSVFFAGCDYFFDTRASIFIFGFLFSIMSITTVLCTLVVKRSPDGSFPGVLLSYPAALVISFSLSLLGSIAIYFVYMKEAVSALQYSASLAAMLVLVLWFAYDASCMNERLSPDEYMQGMVFFYTDMVLFLLFLSIIFVACFACEGDCACYGTADIAPIGGGGGGNDDDEGEMIDEEDVPGH
jgi:hypothetical protein